MRTYLKRTGFFCRFVHFRDTKLDGFLLSLGEFGQFSLLALFHPEKNMAVLWKVLGIRLEDDLPDLGNNISECLLSPRVTAHRIVCSSILLQMAMVKRSGDILTVKKWPVVPSFTAIFLISFRLHKKNINYASQFSLFLFFFYFQVHPDETCKGVATTEPTRCPRTDR